MADKTYYQSNAGEIMRNKREILDRLQKQICQLESINKHHAECVAELRDILQNFIKSNFIKPEGEPPFINHPCFDKPIGIRASINLPLALEIVSQIFSNELKSQKNSLQEWQKSNSQVWEQFKLSLNEAQNCEYCHRLFSTDFLRHLPPPMDNIVICDSCFDDNFFDCHKCKKVLPMSEVGEDDDDLGYGYFCKKCCEPMGFPPEIIVCPEHCEGIAFSDSSKMSSYYANSTGMDGWLEESDGIKLHFVKQISDYRALYENQSGHKYEIGELDCHGLGSMEELEEE